jgi:hypothetical protein
LQDLVEDRRYITVERHLRKIYVDPITGKRDWGLITDVNGAIVGVYSQSREVPLKRDNFPEIFGAFAQAGHYSDWKFGAVIPDTTPAVDGPAPAANGDHAPLPGRGALPRAGG